MDSSEITYVGNDRDGDGVYQFPNGRWVGACRIEDAIRIWENMSVGHDPKVYESRWGPITKERI